LKFTEGSSALISDYTGRRRHSNESTEIAVSKNLDIKSRDCQLKCEKYVASKWKNSALLEVITIAILLWHGLGKVIKQAASV